ncbi:MAG: Hsp33 family molecular chaperone HslO [Lachnospiraceae bacterium]|nr:Hsp33 family molecular chaperone HslO [Lachnospiraceae bacterium]
MKDYVVRAASKNGEVRAFAATTRNTVETAREHHNTSPVMTAALGRLLTAGSMMGYMLQGDDVLTLQIRGDGPAVGLTVTAKANGDVKGYAIEPQVMLHARETDHKLDVGGAIGKGNLQVIKDMGLKEPYVGNSPLRTGEIGDDLTYYFAVSEQIPSSVGLGVLMSHDNTVREAGGFIVQIMPGCSDETITVIENNLKNVTSVTDLLKEGKTPEDIINIVLNGLDPEIYEQLPTQFNCDCSVSKVSKVLISTGEKEMQSMIDDGETIEVKCQFCNKAYHFTVDELKVLLASAKQKGKINE